MDRHFAIAVVMLYMSMIVLLKGQQLKIFSNTKQSVIIFEIYVFSVFLRYGCYAYMTVAMDNVLITVEDNIQSAVSFCPFLIIRG